MTRATHRPELGAALLTSTLTAGLLLPGAARAATFTEDSAELRLDDEQRCQARFSATTGALLGLTDSASAEPLLDGSSGGALWSVVANGTTVPASDFAGNFSYTWNASQNTLTLVYSDATCPHRGEGTRRLALVFRGL